MEHPIVIHSSTKFARTTAATKVDRKRMNNRRREMGGISDMKNSKQPDDVDGSLGSVEAGRLPKMR